MLVMSEASNPINEHDSLTDIEVSEAQEIRDDLQRLAQGYLNDGEFVGNELPTK